MSYLAEWLKIAYPSNGMNMSMFKEEGGYSMEEVKGINQMMIDNF